MKFFKNQRYLYQHSTGRIFVHSDKLAIKSGMSVYRPTVFDKEVTTRELARSKPKQPTMAPVINPDQPLTDQDILNNIKLMQAMLEERKEMRTPTAPHVQDIPPPSEHVNPDIQLDLREGITGDPNGEPENLVPLEEDNGPHVNMIPVIPAFDRIAMEGRTKKQISEWALLHGAQLHPGKMKKVEMIQALERMQVAETTEA